MIQWNLLVFSDLQQQPIPGQLLAFSDAYLDSAEQLCSQMADAPEGKTYAHGAVVMSLTFHALELFFKAAILGKAPTEQFRGNAGHDMDALHRRFKNLYPAKAMQFDVPFTAAVIDTPGIDPHVAEELRQFIETSKKEQPEDQRLRYPIDVKGRPWNGAFGFDAGTFLTTIRGLKGSIAAARVAFPP